MGHRVDFNNASDSQSSEHDKAQNLRGTPHKST